MKPSKNMSRTTTVADHAHRQMIFSRSTFGPGERTAGICDHIRKELDEIVREKNPYGRAREWVDVIILGMDGLWRALEAAGLPWDQIPAGMQNLISMKQGINETRRWPDWRTQAPDKAIEHDRNEE